MKGKKIVLGFSIIILIFAAIQFSIAEQEEMINQVTKLNNVLSDGSGDLECDPVCDPIRDRDRDRDRDRVGLRNCTQNIP